MPAEAKKANLTITCAHVLQKCLHRTDVWARQQDDGSYRPVKRELTDEVLADHVRGEIVVGTYLIQPGDNTVRIGVLDLDLREPAEQLESTLAQLAGDVHRRHHFASLCANHNVAYRKALTWLGHSSSEILELYYHLHDADSQAAMRALAGDGEADPGDVQTDDTVISSDMSDDPAEGTLRATRESTIEKSSEDEREKQLAELLFPETERVGFEPTRALLPHTNSNRAP
jgi:hypothetical protein